MADKTGRKKTASDGAFQHVYSGTWSSETVVQLSL